MTRLDDFFGSADDEVINYVKMLYHKPRPVLFPDARNSRDPFLYALKCDNCGKVV